MIRNKLIWLWLGLALIFFGCEEEFIPAVSVEVPEIIVEGYIEAGERPLPPYVILTRSVPFFSEFEPGQLEGVFVHDAVVTVSNGDREVRLTELCLNELNAEQQELAGRLLGRNLEGIGFNFCAYVDLSNTMRGEVGERYDLLVQVGERSVEASTRIPAPIPIDSLWFVEPPGEPTDTLAQMRCFIQDPAGQADFYRYFTATGNAPLQAGLNSVFEDQLFDGRDFEFPLLKAEPRNTDFDPATFGLFTRGDTVTLKWATIDEAHYDFWNTLEFNAANQGPFSSYTRIASNVSGGLGIWGGLSATYYTRVVPE